MFVPRRTTSQGTPLIAYLQVVRIDQTIKKGELNKVDSIVNCFKRAKDGNGRLHLLGLVSDGGVVRCRSIPALHPG